MNLSVIGCGRWGSFLAWYLRTLGHGVLLYGRKGSAHLEQFRNTRSNGLVVLEDDVALTVLGGYCVPRGYSRDFHCRSKSAGFDGTAFELRFERENIGSLHEGD